MLINEIIKHSRYLIVAAAITAIAVPVVLVQSAGAVLLNTYVTGETASGGAGVIFKVTFDPTVADSGAPVVVVTESRGFGLDGIDFLPSTGDKEVVVGAPVGKIASYNIALGTTLPDIVVDTNAIAVPPTGGAGTHPSSVLTTPAHVYYTENQFGFGGTSSHRIIRKPLAGGPEEVVFDGAVPTVPPSAPLINLEGLEIVDGRLYFHTEDPGDPTKRALVSIGLSGGIHDGAAPVVEIGGLAEGGSGDGADELDFDPGSGMIYGTNIANGEVTIVDPFVAPGTGGGIFISGAAVAGGAADGLGLLLREIDGIRSDGLGNLIFAGRGGVLGAIDIAGVLFDGADDGDVLRLYDAAVEGTTFIFDDLTPLVPIPEPGSLILLGLGIITLRIFGRRV